MLQGSTRTVKTFLAAALFTTEDEQVLAYFKKYRDSLNAMTGVDIVFGLPDEQDGIIKDLDKLFSAEGQQRYPGLERIDLPCLWIEDEQNEHCIIRLPQEQSQLTKLLRGVTDAATKAKSFKEFKVATDDLQAKLNPPPVPSTPQVPSWFPVAGYVSAAVAFLFIVALVFLEIFGKQVPASARILIDIAMAIAVACAFAFIGGNAQAEGKIPAFRGYESIKFATGGGIAVFVVVLALCVVFYH